MIQTCEQIGARQTRALDVFSSCIYPAHLTYFTMNITEKDRMVSLKHKAQHRRVILESLDELKGVNGNNNEQWSW